MDRRINESLLRLIRAQVPYHEIRRALHDKNLRSKEDLLRRLSSLLSFAPTLIASIPNTLSLWLSIPLLMALPTVTLA